MGALEVGWVGVSRLPLSRMANRIILQLVRRRQTLLTNL